MSLSPDQVIAKDNFAAFKAANYTTLSDDDAFERFAADLALKTYAVGSSVIEKGIVGATDDGGLDGIYVFLNGTEAVEADSVRLTRRKDALKDLQPGLSLQVIVVQAKNETNWDTNVFPKVQSALELMLRHDVTAAELRAFPLNDDVVEKAFMLRDLRSKLSMLAPVMDFSVQYISFASQANTNQYMESKRNQLQGWLLSKLPTGSTASVEYVGDAEVVTRLRVSSDFTAKLVFAKPAVRTLDALVGVATIEEYLKFLRQPGSMVVRDELFAVNVRDYAGSNVQVNRAIAETLANDNATEFWWLNNGITIIVDKASDPVEHHWVTTNPLIVNGLQTSHVIHEQALLKMVTKARLKEHVLVRLIIESDPIVREAIIRGTNNQTAIASIQLHANDEKQLRIEEYLRAANWYYERRRYQYRGTGAPAGRVRTVTDVAQAVIAYRLLEPDTARARPRSLLGTSSGWNRIFSNKETEDLYLKALKVAEAVDKYLRSSSAKGIAEDATNARHYLVAGYALLASGVKTLPDFYMIPTAHLKFAPTAAELNKLHKLLHAEAAKLDDGRTARDRIFKGAKLRPSYFAKILAMNSR